MSRGRPAGRVTRYSCAIGTIGTFTPASAPSSCAKIPPAFTTTSASISPLSVATPLTRPPSTWIAGDAGVGRDLSAAPARTGGERERELRGVDVAVGREIGRAENAVCGHRREERLRFGGGDQLERQTEGLCPAGLPRDLLHPLRRRREPKRSDLAPAGLEPDLIADRAIEVDARHHHLRQRERAAQLADEARGVERRARGQVGALDEDHVAPAEPCEPVKDRAAADTAADHYRSRPRLSSHGEPNRLP